MNMGLWVSRVPSKLNIADDPSREAYELLGRMQAVKVVPTLHPRFIAPQAWETVSLRSICTDT